MDQDQLKKCHSQFIKLMKRILLASKQYIFMLSNWFMLMAGRSERMHDIKELYIYIF